MGTTGYPVIISISSKYLAEQLLFFFFFFKASTTYWALYQAGEHRDDSNSDVFLKKLTLWKRRKLQYSESGVRPTGQSVNRSDEGTSHPAG